MLRILALKRLLFATSDFGRSIHAIEQQVSRTQGRLNLGVDVDGNSFAPYKDPKVKRENTRPLQRAARLFESPRYDVDKSLDGAELKATITGQAAKIARYQNFKRRFLGYSRKDREDVREELKSMISEAYHRWRG